MKTENYVKHFNDAKLSIPQYWERYSEDIAELRGWAKEPDGAIKTLNSYNCMMEKLTSELPDKPISQVTFFDLTRAVDGVRYKARGGKPYSANSLSKFYALLGDIFKYAKEHGHADNILLFLQDRNRTKSESVFDFFDPALSTEKMREKAREAVRKSPSKVKSLTKSQRFSLYLTISNGLRKDGRYLGLAIMFYCGLRPSECRGLTWGNIRTFRDYPDRRMFVIYKTQGKKGQKRKQTKTGNAYRYVPIHYELDQLLRQRYEYVEDWCRARGRDPNELYICCLKNQLLTPCEDFQLSAFGSDILNQLRIPRSELILYMAHMITDDMGGVDSASGEDPTHLSLYVLRRNFCTWVQGETLMDEMQRNYVMGHTMWDGKKDLRQQYNGEDSLFRMLQKMDKAVLNGNYKRPPYYFELFPGVPVSLADQGCAIIQIPAPLDGYVVRIAAIAAEADDPILLTSDSPTIRKALKNMTAQITSLSPSDQIFPINTQADEKVAWDAVISRARKRPGEPG